jgi:sialate O-acetylesterase
MTVAGKNTIKLTNILVGEVWAGSGQSNMEWNVRISANGNEEIQAAKHPKIRLFLVPKRLAHAPIDDVDARWVECSPESIPNFSAVLYYFGREIHQKLNVPVGLITVAWGGSRIEPWTTLAEFESNPVLKAELEAYNKSKAERANSRKQYLVAARAWLDAAEKASAAGQEYPAPPAPPADPMAQFTSPVAMYNGMIHGIAPFAMRGALWYQGESNVGQGMHYHNLKKGLVQSWRKVWNQGDFPFLYVQLAPFKYGRTDAALPELWEAQTASLSIPNTGMAVTVDISTIGDIHPPNKQDVGKRLSLWALAKTYGKDLVYSGPLYEAMSIEENKIRLKFQHAAPGLVARDSKPLSWFTIAGEDKVFHPAEATIDGQTIVVGSAKVARPVAVRFGWNQIAEPNLSNKAGLPASPFRTDKWTDATNAPAGQ